MIGDIWDCSGFSVVQGVVCDCLIIQIVFLRISTFKRYPKAGLDAVNLRLQLQDNSDAFKLCIKLKVMTLIDLNIRNY